MLNKDLSALRGMLIIPESPIITLRPYTREIVRYGPTFAIRWKHSELFSNPSTEPLEKIYFDTLMQCAPLERIKQLTYANNLLLATKQTDVAPQQKLNALFLGTLAQQAIQQYVSTHKEDELNLRVVFNRAALLLNIKLLLGITEQQVEDSGEIGVVGDIALLANDFLSSEQPRPEEDAFMISESIPNWEIDNLRDVAYSMARYDFLINTYLPSDDALVTDKRKQLGIDTKRFDGLLLDEYLSLIFAVYATIRGRTGKSIDEQNVNAGMCCVSASNISESLNIAPEAVAQFFERRATFPEKFRNAIANKGWEQKQFLLGIKSDQFTTDITPIRQTPFLKLDDDTYLGLDLELVFELAASGLFWSIFEALPPSPSKDRETLFELWGRIFELYAVDLLRHYYPHSPIIASPLRTDVLYSSDSGNGQIDALLYSGQDIIIFEMKASLLHLKARCSRDWDILRREIHLKFVERPDGKAKGARQLENAASAVASGALSPDPVPCQIFPVLVCDDKAMECLGMNRYLNRVFQSLFNDKPTFIRPLTVMSIDELEEVLPYIESGKISWQEILNSRFQDDNAAIYSVHQSLYHMKQERHIEQMRNSFLLQRFETMWSRIETQCSRLGALQNQP